MKYSPAQMLMSRRLRTKIPVATSLLTPNIVDPSAELIKAQSRQKRYYDRCANPLKPLQKGDVVCYRKNKNGISHVLSMCALNHALTRFVARKVSCAEIAVIYTKQI